MRAGSVEELADLVLDLGVSATGAEELVEEEEEAWFVLDQVGQIGDEDVEHVVHGLGVAKRLIEAGDADLRVAADDLDQQPLLGAEVVVEQAAAHPGLAGDMLEGRAGGATHGDALAHRVDDALRFFPAQLALFGRCLHRESV